MEQNYRKELEEQLKASRERLADLATKENFAKKPEGKLLNDYLTNRISLIVTKMTSSKAPMEEREYLAAHGAVQECQKLLNYLNGYTAEEMETENAIIESTEQQLADLNGTTEG